MVQVIRSLGVFLLFSVSSSTCFGSGGPIFDAIDQLVLRMQKEVPDLAERTSRTAIVALAMSENLEPEVRDYLMKRLESISHPQANFKFVQCRECLMVRAETNGDEIVIKKGITDKKEMQKVASSLSVRSYTEVNLIYSGAKAVLSVNVYSARDSSVLWAGTYSARLLRLSKTGLKASASVYQVVGLTKNGVPIGFSLFGAERIYGLGEVGLNAFVTTSSNSYYSYFSIGPEFLLNLNEVFGMNWSWGALLWSFKTAFGWYSGRRDISFGSGVKLEFGNIFHSKIEMIGGVGVESSSDAAPVSFLIGFGFDLG